MFVLGGPQRPRVIDLQLAKKDEQYCRRSFLIATAADGTVIIIIIIEGGSVHFCRDESTVSYW